MLPARQHLEAAKAARGQVDLLLEIGNDLQPGDRTAQTGFELVARLELALHRQVEPGEAIATRILRGVHGDIGRAHQGVDARAIEIGARDAQRGADMQLEAFGLKRLGHARHEALGDPLDGIRMGGIEQERAREFVAAETRGERDRGHRRGDLDRNLAEQGVAGRMTVHVVDGLEVIEVQHQHRHRLAATLGAEKHRRTFLAKAAAVEEARQRILRGELLGALLGGGADRHFKRELAVASPAEQDQRDVEQQRDYQRLVGALAPGEIMPERGGQH